MKPGPRAEQRSAGSRWWQACRSELRAQVFARPWMFRLFLRWTHMRQRRPARVVHGTPDPVDSILHAFARNAKDVRFVQIGSNDGFTNDPLVRHIQSRGWRGVLVEPVPYIFRRLHERHRRNGRLILENIAIGERDGSVPFYQVRERDDCRSTRYDQIGSFSREHVLKHSNLFPGVETRVVQVDVPCLTFESLCNRHCIEHLDLIHIDAEGFDYTILKGIDLVRHRPRLLLFESFHMSDAQRRDVVGLLGSHGYAHLVSGLDTLAVHQKVLLRWPEVRLAFEEGSRRAVPLFATPAGA